MNRNETMKERRKALSIAIDVLDAIYKHGKVLDADVGLCVNVTNPVFIEMSDVLADWLWDEMFHYFAKSRFSPKYPVEGCGQGYDKNTAKYDRSTEFGARRLRLAEDLAEYFREIRWRTW